VVIGVANRSKGPGNGALFRGAAGWCDVCVLWLDPGGGMLGAIAGDVIGSIYENRGLKHKDFALFRPQSTYTDDTVLTLAVADAVLHGSSYVASIKSYAKRYPMRGYGPMFIMWMQRDDLSPYNSFGNGSAMRVSPVAHAFESLEKVLDHAKRCAECTHNHPEGIKGAQAVALAIYLARMGTEKDALRDEIQSRFGYDLSPTLSEIRPNYSVDLTCQGSVPEAIIAFLESRDWEDAVRNAVSLGGDADTQACIAGAIAEAYYKSIPLEVLSQVKQRLDEPLWRVATEFSLKHGVEEVAEQLDSLKRGSR